MSPSSGFVIYRLINNGIQTGVRWYLRVVCMSISLLMSDDDFFFLVLVALCISRLGKCQFRTFAHFLKLCCLVLLLGGQASNIEPTA